MTAPGGDEEVVGTAVIRVLVDRSAVQGDLDRAVDEAGRRTEARARVQGQRNGAAFGDAYTRTLRTKLDAASKALPDIRLDANTTPIDTKIHNVKAQIDLLRHAGDLGLNLDDREIRARLEEVRAELTELSGPGHTIQVRVNARTALAEIAALRTELGIVDAKTEKIGSSAKGDAKEFNLLRVAIEQLGPPLIPLAGGALALGSALVGLGPAALLGIKGATDAFKNGTDLGQQYAGGINNIKGAFEELKQTSASGLLDGFNRSISSIRADLPQVNSLMDASSRNLGDIGANLTHGIIAGLNTFTPLILKAEGYLDGFTSKFDKWATGSGGEHFAKTLSDDLDLTVQALSTLVPLVVHLGSAFAPVGSVMLRDITALAGALDSIPVGVLQAGATAYIAFRTAVTVTSGIKAAAVALEAFSVGARGAAAASAEAAAAEGAAGAAGAAGGAARGSLAARAAGGLAVATRAIVPYALAWTGAAIAINTVSDSTKQWRQSTDSTKAVLADTSHFLGSVLTFNLKGAKDAINDISVAGHNQSQQALAQTRINQVLATTYQRVSNMLPTGGQVKGPEAFDWVSAQGEKLKTTTRFYQEGTRAVIQAAGAQRTYAIQLSKVNEAQASYNYERAAHGENSAQAASAHAFLLANIAALNQLGTANLAAKAKAAAFTATLKSQNDLYLKQQAIIRGTAKQYVAPIANSNLARVNNTLQHSVLTEASSNLDEYNKGLKQAIDAETKWTAVTDDNTVKVGKNTYERAAWNEAVAESNGSIPKAVGILEGHTQALNADQAALRRSQTYQENLSKAIGSAEDKYKLTDAQISLYAESVGITADQVARGTVTQFGFNLAIGDVKGFIDSANNSVLGWISAIDQFNKAGDTAASRAGLIGAAMVALQGDTLGYANTMVQAATANHRLITDFNATGKGVINLKNGFIDYHNAGAAPVLNDLQQLQTAAMNAASATYQHEVSLGHAKTAAKDAADVFRNDTYNALVSQHKQLGITREAAEKLATRYFHWPKNAKTLISQLGGKTVQGTLSDILTQLEYLNGFKAKPSVDANTYDATSKLTALQQYIDNMHGRTIPISIASGAVGGTKVPVAKGSAAAFGAGGKIPPNQQFTVGEGSDHTWEYGESDSQGRVAIYSNRQSKAMGIPAPTAYAGGTGGEHGGFSGEGGTGSGPGSSSSGSGSSGSSTAKKPTALSRTALNAFLSALSGSLWQVRKAEDALDHAVDKATGGPKLNDWLRKENKELNHEVAARNKAADQLAKASTHYQAELQKYHALENSVKSAVTGSFDITTAGASPVTGKVSLGGIIAQEKQAALKATKFETLLKKLIKEGYNSDFVADLGSKGPEAYDQALALSKASPAQIRGINSQDNKIKKAAKETSKAVADDVYGESVKVAKALVYGFNPKNKEMRAEVEKLANSLYGAGKYAKKGLAKGLRERNSELTKAVKDIANEIIAGLKKHLKISSPSKETTEIGQNVTRGMVLGMRKNIHEVASASHDTAMAAIPKPFGNHHGAKRMPGGHGGGHVEDPRLDGLIAAMQQWFSSPPALEVDGVTFGMLVDQAKILTSRLN